MSGGTRRTEGRPQRRAGVVARPPRPRTGIEIDLTALDAVRPGDDRAAKPSEWTMEQRPAVADPFLDDTARGDADMETVLEIHPRVARATSVARAPRATRRSALRPVLDVASNSAFALGAIFLLDNAGLMAVGAPHGVAGLAGGATMIVAGVAAAVVPSRRRRVRRHARARSFARTTARTQRVSA